MDSNRQPITRNYLRDITSHIYSKVNPTPNAHTFLLLDSEGECVEEFTGFYELQEFYFDLINNEYPVGRILAIEMVTLQ